jgi:glycosyltransferase involved in cell wall biosynthesis
MRSPLKIAYLISQYPAVNHTYILGEVRGLRGQGIEVEVISLKLPDRRPEKLSDVEREEAKAAWYVSQQSLAAAQLKTFLRHPVAYLSTLIYALRMSRFTPTEIPRWVRFFLQAAVVGVRLRQLALDHLHVHYASSVGLLVTRLFGVPVSHTFHGSAEFLDARTFRLREKVRHADFIVAISQFGRSQVMLFSDPSDWPRVEVCRLGIDPDDFAPIERRRSPDVPFRLLTIGQLASAKGPPVLIAALARLIARGRNVRLVLVGDGPLRTSLEHQAQELGAASAVRFEGFRNNAELRHYYADADAFALASFAEGVPVVLMEAMATGLPCIASCIAGIPELIEHGVSGLLTPPGDEESIAAAIERLMDDEELRRRLGESARGTVAEHYDVRRNTARLADIFRHRSGAAGTA